MKVGGRRKWIEGMWEEGWEGVGLPERRELQDGRMGWETKGRGGDEAAKEDPEREAEKKV